MYEILTIALSVSLFVSLLANVSFLACTFPCLWRYEDACERIRLRLIEFDKRIDQLDQIPSAVKRGYRPTSELRPETKQRVYPVRFRR